MTKNFNTGKRIAITIGINEHLHMPAADLRFASQDACDVADLLADPQRGGFDVVHRLLDGDATKNQILSLANTVLSNGNLSQDDFVLIFFAGHGELDHGENLYLIPHDFSLADDGSIELSSVIHIKELEILLDNTNAGQVVIIIDACHSGASGKVLGRIRYRDDQSIVLVGACRFSELALESAELEHGRFSHYLLQAASLEPTYHDWITLNQAIAHIEQQMSQWGNTQAIEVSSHAVNITIPFYKNPYFSLESIGFKEKIEELFRLAGYEIMPLQPDQKAPSSFVAQEHLGFGGKSETFVMCLNNDVINVVGSHIADYNEKFLHLQVGERIANGMLITRNKLPSYLVQQLTPQELIKTTTEYDLQTNLIDFRKYLNSLIKDFKYDSPTGWEPPLYDHYIELDARYIMKSHEQQPITEHIQAWIGSDKPAAIVLGGYGTGKTTFARKLAFDLATDYLADDNAVDNNVVKRIPILLYLRDFPRSAVDMEAFMVAQLQRRCQVRSPDFAAFETMNNAGLLLLIFDGFDEMVVRADADTIRRNLAAIERFAAPEQAKVLLTSRPEFFRNIQEEDQLFSAQSTLRKRPFYQRYALLPMTEEQVEGYLQKRISSNGKEGEPAHDWTYYRDKIRSIPGFADLTRRPVLLEMVVKTLPELIDAGESINRASLYNRYLRGEIDRQQEHKQRDLLINREDRLRLIKIIARHFYTENPPGLSADEISALLEENFSRSQREEFEAHTRDFLTVSFLIRDGDLYRFSHRSIMEYLAASVLSEEIEENRPDLLNAHKLTPEVRDFLVDLRPASDSQWHQTLWEWIENTKIAYPQGAKSNVPPARGFGRRIKYLGGNAVTLLNFMKQSLEGKNFNNTIIIGGDFRRANCSKTTFRNAFLQNIDFTESNLSHADFSNIQLQGLRYLNENRFEYTELSSNIDEYTEPSIDPFSDEDDYTEPAVLPDFDILYNSCSRCETKYELKLHICSQCGENQLIEAIDWKSQNALISHTIGLNLQPSHWNENTLSLKQWMLEAGAVEEHSENFQDDADLVLIPEPLSFFACPTCSSQNTPDAIVCSVCGTSLKDEPEVFDYYCSQCQIKIQAGNRFCGYCGSLLAKSQCSGCHILNEVDCNQCKGCHEELPVIPDFFLVSSPPTATLLKQCPLCKGLNEPDAESCSRCAYAIMADLSFTAPYLDTENEYTDLYTESVQPTSMFQKFWKRIQSAFSSRHNRQAPLYEYTEFADEYTEPYSSSQIDTKYLLLNEHARGGFSAVHLSQDLKHENRLVIIKEFVGHPSLVIPEQLGLFQQESQLLQNLQHDCLPRGIEYLEWKDKHYSVVEYIPGNTLKEIVDSSQQPLDQTTVLQWALLICDLLEYLHTQQPPIIVRDITPSNFVLSEQSQVPVLVDLSISRYFKEGQQQDTIMFGTRGYSPPEQHGKYQTDGRADIYGLGALLFRLLTRHNPATTPFVFPNPLELNPQLDPGWREILSRATQLDRERRYPSIAEMRAALETIPH